MIKFLSICGMAGVALASGALPLWAGEGCAGLLATHVVTSGCPADGAGTPVTTTYVQGAKIKTVFYADNAPTAYPSAAREGGVSGRVAASASFRSNSEARATSATSRGVRKARNFLAAACAAQCRMGDRITFLDFHLRVD